ncbi:hypothetical protein AYO44_00325 [Planctomycetaceae bacterium SCGC AG-212-F19]|nr:hypothetical protein AYO44_00325 [Planctomycetaceae bacterium SCGC AG-212-F19]
MTETRCANRLFLRRSLGVAVLLIVALWGNAARAGSIPEWLPRYDLDIQLDVAGHEAKIREKVTWTNRHDRHATELVFNVHSHYQIPDDEIGFLAKMAEILRMAPHESMDFDGPPCQVSQVRLISSLRPEEVQQAAGRARQPTAQPPAPQWPGTVRQVKHDEPDHGQPGPLTFHWKEDNNTALVIPLPSPVSPGESVTVELEFTLRLPQKQGRWGQWKGVTFLSNCLPVLAFYDDKGWQPTPFIPWHQPWFNEAGVYHASLTLPEDEKVACTGSVSQTENLGDGRKRLEISVPAARDFAIITSNRFVEIGGPVGPVKAKVLALPEHQDYARAMFQIIADAMPVYAMWFGPYPYQEFTLVESYFGWLGNECGGLVMIDERVFDAPKLARGYVEYLVSHEVCHQWWYNVVGTNGYAETWMDEGMATYFAHRLIDHKRGKNNNLLQYPAWLEWLPNIYRENYRYYGLYGTLGRGDYGPTVQEIPKFGQIVNLFSMTYDKGAKIVGMIEDRLGEAAFFDFMHTVYDKYYFKIMRVADFEQELEHYTGHTWEPFFQDWLYGKGISDWAVEKVVVGEEAPCLMCRIWPRKKKDAQGLIRTTVLLHQKAECNEPTVLGICMKEDGCSYQIRIPIVPNCGHMQLDDPQAEITTLPGNRVRVEVLLPGEPKQIAVDPDQVLVDRDPSNNYWKCWHHWRLTPLYTFLDETDLTNDYDKWNFIAGPWLYLPPAYADPWFTRSTMLGVRADAYRTQQFDGGVFAAYRYTLRDFIIGTDGLWDHCPWPHTQIGFTVERRLDAYFQQSDQHANRAVIYGRYVIDYGSSLYLPPMQYVEGFGSVQNNFLPVPKDTVAGAVRYDGMALGGLHYHKDYLTPYWDPEGGYLIDTTYASGGVKVPGERDSTHQFTAQISAVKNVPEGLGWLSSTRVAGRIYGAGALPDRVEFFPLGGDERFRGYSIAQRQGSLVWIGSLEWRVPVATGLTYSCVDHIIGLRNIYVAGFYDVGSAYAAGKQIGDVAHAVGAGLRLDVAWFSFVERTILRVDIAKTVNDTSPVQVWLGVQHPF